MVDVDDLQEQRGHDAESSPKHQGKVLVHFSLLAQFEQSGLSCLRVEQLRDQDVDLFLLAFAGRWRPIW